MLELEKQKDQDLNVFKLILVCVYISVVVCEVSHDLQVCWLARTVYYSPGFHVQSLLNILGGNSAFTLI